MATVFDVAKYILNKNGDMSTMKLQKLCYYSQAWSLVWDDKPLFEEEFEAWVNGPVCRELFNEHKGVFRISQRDISGDINNLKKEQIETINIVLDHYGNKDAQWLSTLTHMEKPWRDARSGFPDGYPCGAIILKQNMADYYGSL